jgi:REP element-mobilizing transposase RayT
LPVQNESNERAGRAFYYEFPDAMATASEHFFSRFAQAEVHTRNLPHWAANKSLIFITYRLADSMPAAKLRVWQDERDEWLRINPEPWDAATASEYYETFPAKLDEMLDAGYGSCILGREDCRNVVVENLLHFNGECYVLHAFVVMPNHLHVLLEIERREDLARVVQGWKSYTAKRINEVVGSEGQVWQREYYDRLIRNAEHYERTVEYIRKNARMAEGLISRTAGSAVQDMNARAARSTSDARCTMPSRTGCLPVQEDNIL